MTATRQPRTRGGPSGRSAVAAIGLSFVAVPAAAIDFQVNPRLELAAGYDDNANLAVAGQSKIGSAEGIADARVDVIAREINWQWRVTPEVHGAAYPGNTDLNSDGEFLYLSGQRTGARYTLNIDGYGSSQSLLTSYLPTANIGTGLGVPEPGTTLVIPASIRQNLGYLSPSYAFAMTPRSSFELNAGFTDATYSEQLQGGYVNYQNITGSTGVVFAVSTTGSVTLRANGQDFRPSSGDTSKTYGVEAQWDGNSSATKRYYLRVGVGRTDVSGPIAGASGAWDSTNWTGGAGIHWTYRIAEVFVDATRSIAPTAQGYVVNQDQLRLRVARRLTPRFAAFLGMRAIEEDPLRTSAAPAAPTQHYNYATAGFEWRVRRYFSVVAGYDFTDYRYGGPSGQANAIQVSFVYEPHRPADGPAITVGY